VPAGADILMYLSGARHSVRDFGVRSVRFTVVNGIVSIYVRRALASLDGKVRSSASPLPPAVVDAAAVTGTRVAEEFVF